PEVEAGYMTLGDWIDGIAEDIREAVRDEVKAEVKAEVREEVVDKVTREIQEQDIRTVIEMFQEYHETKERAVAKIRVKFPRYADMAEELLEKYWQ
ncbi:MAG: putative porin, partial [Lachnospiraceae bacterium]|nr:putative porin [Lachnospiraceae bacterium]